MRVLALLIPLLLALPLTAAAQEDDARLAEIEDYVLTSTPDWADRDAIREALIDAGGNWSELAAALSEVYPGASQPYDEQDYHNLVWLLEHATHLDRLELTAAILTENMDEALAIAGRRGFDTSGELFRRYVLNYRLDDEPVTLWRRELRLRYSGGEPDLPATLLRITAGFQERERGYYGNLADPVSVDNARAGTGRELAILTAAVLRAQGYATRFVKENLSGESWVEVYDGGGEYDAATWLPVYPSAPERSGETAYAAELCGGRIALVTAGDAFGREQVTGRYSPLCAVRPRFSRAGESQPEFEHYSITAWHEGTYVPLDDLGYPLGELEAPPAAADDGGDVYYVGAPGDYRLQCGVRYPGAVVHVQTRDFEATPGGDVLIEVALDAPADLPRAALIERTVEWQWEREDDMPPLMLVVVCDDDEPSVRASELLARFAADERVLLGLISYDDESSADFAAWIREDLKVTDEDEKPVVILLDGEGGTLLYRRGYDLNIAQWVERAVEAAVDTDT